MTQEELTEIIADYMKENNIGFISITASTDITGENVVANFHEEFEDDIQDYGYKC